MRTIVMWPVRTDLFKLSKVVRTLSRTSASRTARCLENRMFLAATEISSLDQCGWMESVINIHATCLEAR